MDWTLDQLGVIDPRLATSCRTWLVSRESERRGVPWSVLARREIITDDITGEDGASPVVISIDGEVWTIDLTPASRAKLDKTLAPFLAKATKVQAGSGRAGATKKARRKNAAGSALDVEERAKVRAWAAKNKVDLPARGRIPGAVVEQYREQLARK